MPRIPPLQLPPGYFILQRALGQYQALREEEPGLYRAVAAVRTRRTTAAADVYRHVALGLGPAGRESGRA